jgi:MFS transporter, putative metabolite:H+ symporter
MSRSHTLSAHEHRVLFATCLASLGSYYTMAVTGFALPQIQRGLGIPEESVGSVLAVIRCGTLFSLALAVFADRRGRRRLLVGSVAGCALANIATAFAPSGAALAGLQLVSRCFLGAQTLLASVVVSEELAAEHRGRGLGILNAVGGMGGALALGGFACVDRLPHGWRALFVLGGFGLCCVPWLRRSLGETRRFADQAVAGSPGASVGELVRRYGGRLALLVGIVVPLAILIEPASLLVSKHLQDDLGYTPGGVGLLMAVCGIATPLGNFVGGVASDRLGRKPVTIVTSLVLSIAVALFYGDTGPAALVVGLALLFASIGAIMVLHTALATELFPTGFRSTAAGVREAVATVGAAAGLVVLSMLYPVTGGHARSLTWLLVVTPISPLVLLVVPETARRELEEIAPSRAQVG